jgi:hypothetical protein
MYSPKLGRFLQQDPAGYVDGANIYQFGISNPLSYVDPSGTIVVFVLGHNPLWGWETDHKKNAGLTKLRADLEANGPDTLGKYIVLSRDNHDRAIELIRKAKKENPCEPVALIGHSWGGEDVLDIAEELGKGANKIMPDLVIAVDPVGWGKWEETKLTNAGRLIHIRPNGDPVASLKVMGAIGGGAYNKIKGAELFRIRGTNHTKIDDDPRVHEIIKQALDAIAP